MNRGLFRRAFETRRAVFVVVLCAALCSCISASPPKIFTYDLNRKIYPAAWEYFAQRQVPIEMIDPDNDEVATGFILEYSLSSSRHYRYKLTVKGESGVIRPTIERQYQEGYSTTWKSTSAYSREAEATLEAISKLVQSPDYEQKKQNLNKDLLFNFLVLRDLTELGRERWFNEHMKGTEFDFNLSLSSAAKNTSSKSGKKYVAGFYFGAEKIYTPVVYEGTRQATVDTVLGPIPTTVPYNSFGSLPDKASGFSIDYYTDDERVATIRPGTRVSVRAKLINNSILTTTQSLTITSNGKTFSPGTIFVLELE